MTRAPRSEGSIFLATAAPGPGERRLAIWVAALSTLFFLAAVPFAKVPLAKLPVFIPMYEAALIVNDLITATLLFIQYRILRSRALLVLGAGYLFAAFMEVFHLLSFPGAFAPTGLLGAGPQTTVWLYLFWHGLFPLFVIAYAVLDARPDNGIPLRLSNRTAILGSIGATFLLACAIAWLVTAGHDLFPVLMTPTNSYEAPMIVTISAMWALSVVALAVLWRRRTASLINMWLAVVMFAWLLDIALAAVLNGGRFDLGFYVGRIYGLMAASFVLIVLLLDNGRLYAHLADAHRRERFKNASLARLSRRLENVNTALADKSLQLQSASRLKSEFLASMSHELRTPLNAIIGFSEVLKDGMIGELRPEQREYIADIFSSGQHLLSLINDILDLSKIEAGKMTLDLEPGELEPILRNGLAIVREKAAAQRITLMLDMPEPPGAIKADLRKTKQIVYNLLSNAVKFTGQGGAVTLSARPAGRDAIENWTSSAPTRIPPAMPSAEFSEFIEISVADTGQGIAPHEAPRLFQPFSQIDGSLNRSATGTGLGLVLTLELARLHGGAVALSSTPGQGSCFTVWLPRRPVQEAAAKSLAPAGGNAGVGAAEGTLVLLIEDNPHAAELVALQLRSEGLEVLHASTAQQALDLLAVRRPHLIILDILLPDMDGWDLLALIKHPKSPSCRIPVVIVSIVAEAQKGFALGAVQVLQKPVAREEMLLTLENLGLRSTRPPVKVLVVDDDPVAVQLVSTYLSDSRYQVLQAYGGAEGIEICRSQLPDLVILDLMMPQVNGLDVIQDLRSDSATAAIPVVVLTAKSLTSAERSMLLGYIDTILEKSDIGHARFADAVQRALDTVREEKR